VRAAAQGDYKQETVFGADPAAMARRWVGEGATYLHIVDLDGAKAGQPLMKPAFAPSSRPAASRVSLAAGCAPRDKSLR